MNQVISLRERIEHVETQLQKVEAERNILQKLQEDIKTLKDNHNIVVALLQDKISRLENCIVKLVGLTL